MNYFNKSGPRSGGSSRSFEPRRSFGGGDREERRMYGAVCDKCGRECEVPFRPNGSKPIYCSNCFEKNGDRDENRSFGGNNDRSFSNSKPRIESRSYDQPDNSRQLNELSAKLDKIISMLSGNNAPAVDMGEMVAPVKKKKAKTIAAMEAESDIKSEEV